MFLFRYKGYLGFSITSYCSLHVIFFGMLLLLLLLFGAWVLQNEEELCSGERAVLRSCLWVCCQCHTFATKKSSDMFVVVCVCVCLCVCENWNWNQVWRSAMRDLLCFFVVLLLLLFLALTWRIREPRRLGKKENIKYMNTHVY